MAHISLRRHMAVSFLIVSILLVHVLHSQELNQSDEGCDGCWGTLDAVVNTVARSIADNYRHRATSGCTEEYDGAEQPVAYFQHNIFRRSASTSTSIECQSCWMVLRRLKTYSSRSHGKDDARFRHLVKKTMLNNGWV